MKRNEFEALALLRRRVKEMRANGEKDPQHDAGAAIQPQEQIEEESRDFKSSFCELRNKKVKCRNVEDLSGKQNEGREWVKIHFIPWAEASFRGKRQKRWDQMTATRADTLPMGVGNDKRVDRKNKASSDCSVNVFGNPKRKRVGGTKLSFNPQTAIRKNRTNQI